MLQECTESPHGMPQTLLSRHCGSDNVKKSQSKPIHEYENINGFNESQPWQDESISEKIIAECASSKRFV